MEFKLQYAKEENDELRLMNLEYQRQMKELVARNIKIVKENDLIKTENDKLVKEINQVEKNLNTVEERLNQFNQLNRNNYPSSSRHSRDIRYYPNDDQLKSENEEIKKLKQQIETVQKEREIWERRSQNLQKKLTILEKEIENEKTKNQMKDPRVENQKLRDLQDENAKLRVDNQTLRGQIQELQKRLNDEINENIMDFDNPVNVKVEKDVFN